MAGLAGRPFAPLGPVSEALVEYLRRSVVAISSDGGYGSGVVWTADGLVITNDHVAQDDTPTVELADGRRVRGLVVARDRLHDLAAIRVTADALQAATPGDSRSVRVGQILIAVGHPLGVRDTATLGIVSGIGTAVRKGRHESEMLQADIQILPGNSGGPLADAGGRVLGIACMVVSPGIALAVPTHVVQEFADGLVGRRRSYAGRAGA